LSSIPYLKRLFGSTETQIQQTDIVLMLTPHIIRIPDITEEDLQPLWVGTESNVELRGSSRQSAFASPFEDEREERKYPGIPDIPEDEFMAGAEKEEAEPAEDAPPQTALPAAAAPLTVAPSDTQPAESDTGGPNEQAPPPPPPPPIGGVQPTSPGSPGTQPPPGGPPPQPSGPATVTLNPSYLTATIGKDFTVSVAISGAVNVGSVPFHLGFDPAHVEFIAAGSTSPFLSRDGTPVFVLATAGSQGREVIAGLSRQGNRPGADGQGVLLEMTFRPKKPGTTTINFTDISVLDPQAQPLPFERLGMTVVIQ